MTELAKRLAVLEERWAKEEDDRRLQDALGHLDDAEVVTLYLFVGDRAWHRSPDAGAWSEAVVHRMTRWVRGEEAPPEQWRTLLDRARAMAPQWLAAHRAPLQAPHAAEGTP